MYNNTRKIEGEIIMRKIPEDRAKYIEDWTKENRDRILLRIPKGKKLIIKGYSDALNMSSTRFINQAIDEYIESLREKEGQSFRDYVDLRIENLKAQAEMESDNEMK